MPSPNSSQAVNCAFDPFVEIFGEAGRHARPAVDVSALPRNAMVELQMVVSLQ
jgi:enamine deaminase RidA (YjgF/YER057c/UK114 family)